MNNVSSPRTDDHGIEQMIQAKGKTAPRVTPQDILNAIEYEYFFTAAHGAMGEEYLNERPSSVIPAAMYLLTFCVLVLKNGFTVTGESACASPENFDAEIGKKIAYENAKQKIWPLMGYALRQQLHESNT